MVFKGSQKVLFDNAYQAYREIIDCLREIFYDESGNPIVPAEEPLEVHTLEIANDIYIQTNLFKIANADNRVSESEKHFITSLIDNEEILKKSVDGYRKFITLLDADSLDALKGKGFYSDTFIPGILLATIAYDKGNNTQLSYDAINKIETILRSLIELEGLDVKVEESVLVTEIDRLKDFVQSQGITYSTQVEESTESDFEEKSSTLSELLDELSNLTGLLSVKEDVNSTINFLRINEMRKQKGLPSVPVSNHMVFLGNPGTGKTTVARLLAKIYKELGVVSKGQLIETDRSGLVAGYVGQTALKTTDVVKKAIGGVLFIDEAYSLTSSDSSNDFGGEAIDTLVKMMEDNRENLVVIVAGYSNEMHKFIESNPGLSSRFNRYFTFDDYSPEELVEIFKSICRKHGFVVSESAIKELEHIISTKEDMAKFGNARGIRNIFDKAILNQADRLMKKRDVTKLDLSTIIASDIAENGSIADKDKPIGFNTKK